MFRSNLASAVHFLGSELGMLASEANEEAPRVHLRLQRADEKDLDRH
jgi:hypothetical protein